MSIMVLKHRDLELLRFEWTDLGRPRVTSINEAARRFMPLDFKGEVSDASLFTWLSRRTVPRGRAHIQDLLLKFGLDPHNLRAIIELCHGLSLNDVYWIVGDSFKGLWADCNLYDNPFSKTISYMVFTGGGSSVPQGWSSSPEFTTNGMLAKCWRRLKDEVLLYKGGTEGAVNAGFEPYSEYYAAQIAKAMGLEHVAYGISKFKGRVCSTCPLFTSDRYGFLPAGRLVETHEALEDPRFADIFLFDAIILNTDRHLGNFGYMIDNDTNQIVGAAPIFDNGCGLFSLAVYLPGGKGDEFCDLRTFASRVHPALYLKWLDIKGGLTPDMLKRVEALRGFRFKPHPNYNLPTCRLRIIENFLQNRISKIIEYGVKADEFLKVSSLNDNVNHKQTGAHEHDSNVALKEILSNMGVDPFVSYEELADIVGLSKSTVVRYVAKLKAEHRVVREGSDKTGSWKVIG